MSAASQQWSGSTNAMTGHVCNCIGCCRRCGMCRTNPLHSPLTCERVAAWKSQNPLLTNIGTGS